MKNNSLKILIVILSLTFIAIIQSTHIDDKDRMNNIKFTNPQTAQIEENYSGIGIPLNVTEFGEGTFIDNFVNVSNNENASVIIPNGWKAEQLQFEITELYEYDKKWVDETFDSGYDSTYWSSYTDRPENVTFGWYNAPSGANDSIYIRFEEANEEWRYLESHWSYSFNLPREQIAFEDWEISYNYRILYSDDTWLNSGGGSKHNFWIGVDDWYQNFDQIKFDTLENNTWYQDSIVPFSPEQYNLYLPGKVSLNFSIYYGNVALNPSGYFEIYYDNITLHLSTHPEPTQIALNITDITNGQDTAVINGIDPIIGTADLNNIWIGSTGGTTHYFSFNHNSSGTITLSSEIHSKASSSPKTKTMLGLEGTEFSISNSITTWIYYFAVSIPGTYSSGYYVNISKPINWNVIQVINPYGSDKINDVIETAGVGNSTLIIPNNIVTNGLWKMVAKSPNYINQAKIFKKSGLSWHENDSFQEFDKLKINATIDDSLISDISSTNSSLCLYYPNGTLWYQINSEVDINGFVEFPEIILGPQNTTIGQYTIQVIWNNNDNNISQVGFKTLNFEVFHDSNLQRSNFHDNQRLIAFSGDYLVFKVNYTDLYAGLPIDNADVSFTVHNATPIFGDMIYQGGGIYFADFDTTTLQLGLYNITVSANETYFEAKIDILLFELEIQLYTSLERISYPTFVQWNENITLGYRYKDSYDVGITGATISLNIAQHYIISIDDLGSGNYIIEIESAAFGGIGTHQISANFSALKYETQIDTIQFEIIAQDVDLEVAINSELLVESEFKEFKFQESINISARAFAGIDNEYLSGGTFTLIGSKYQENLTESIDTFYSLNLTLSGSDFNNGLNTIFVRFHKNNYTTSFFSFQLMLLAQSVNLSAQVDNQAFNENDLLEKAFNDEFQISCRAFVEIEGTFLSGGNITFVSRDYELQLGENADYWFNQTIVISKEHFTLGPNTVYLRFEQNNYTTTVFVFQLLVNQIEINVDTLDFEGLISGTPGESILIRLNLTEAGSLNYIENATVYYSWNFGAGYFNDIGNGIYETELSLPSGFVGNYNFEIIISKEGILYKTKEFAFFIDLNQPEGPNLLIWIIIFGLIAIIGILGALSLRSYVILPRRREREADLLDTVQVFKDVRNIRAVVLIQRDSGLPIYSEEIAMEKDQDRFLISGFIQAITAFSEAFIGEEFKASKKLATDYEYLRTIIDLDFKFFQLLVCDFESVRVLLILREEASEQLKKQLYLLATILHSKFGEDFKNFTGSLGKIDKELQNLLYQTLFLHYHMSFEVTPNKTYLQSIIESGDLTKLETRLINVISSIAKLNKKFTLRSVMAQIEEKNEDFILEALNTLILRKLIISPYSPEIHLKKERTSSKLN